MCRRIWGELKKLFFVYNYLANISLSIWLIETIWLADNWPIFLNNLCLSTARIWSNKSLPSWEYTKSSITNCQGDKVWALEVIGRIELVWESQK